MSNYEELGYNNLATKDIEIDLSNGITPANIDEVFPAGDVPNLKATDNSKEIINGDLVVDVINERIDTANKYILSDFIFSPEDFSGALKTGNITWNNSTGAVTGGTGILINKNGIIGVLSGVTKFSITTDGNATFAGDITGATGTFGSVTINSGTIQWSTVAGTTNAPSDNATVGATWNSNITGQPSDSAITNPSYITSTKITSTTIESPSITAGSLTGSTINVPDSTTPLFSVDSSGNCKVKSLARDDFHLFTFFESVDGYGKFISGAGGVTLGNSNLLIYAGALAGNNTRVNKNIIGLSFSKNTKIKTSISVDATTSQTIYIAAGDISPATDRHIGFKISNSTLYGSCANGTTQTLTNLSTTILANYTYELEAVLDASTGYIKYYVDGSYVAQTNTNVPSASSLNYVIDISILTSEDLGKNLYINWIDFWQAR